MAVEESIYTVLSGDATVSSLVSDRIRPDVIGEQDDLPAIAYFVLSSTRHPDVCTGVADGLKRSVVQFSCWADTRDGASDLAEAVRSALGGASTFDAVYQSETSTYESDRKIYGLFVDYAIWQ